MNKKLLVGMAAGVAIVFAMGLVIGYMAPRLGGLLLPKQGYGPSAVLRQVQTVSELVTVKYVIEKVVILEDVKWLGYLGENRVLMVAHGVVKAGIDLSHIREGDIEITGKKVTIKLPAPRVFETYLDERQTYVIERSTGLLRAFDKDLEQNARIQAVGDIQRAARNGGILKDAEVRAKAQLASLFLGMGFDSVDFKAR